MLLVRQIRKRTETKRDQRLWIVLKKRKVFILQCARLGRAGQRRKWDQRLRIVNGDFHESGSENENVWGRGQAPTYDYWGLLLELKHKWWENWRKSESFDFGIQFTEWKAKKSLIDQNRESPSITDYLEFSKWYHANVLISKVRLKALPAGIPNDGVKIHQ